MTKRWSLILICLLLPGCFVQSLNPFYTENLVVELPQIEGTWDCLVAHGDAVTAEDPVSPWVFEPEHVQTYDSYNRFSEIDVTYFKVKDRLYMDFIAGRPTQDEETGNMIWCAGVMLTHSLARVEITGDKLVLTPIQMEWITEKMKAGELNLKHIEADSVNTMSGYLFLASSAEWVAFLEKYGAIPELFDPEFRFEFRRGKAASGAGTVPETTAAG